MDYNIYQILSEKQIDNILNNNKDKLILLLFFINNTKYFTQKFNLIFKKYIKRTLSIKYKNVIFLYIDLANYTHCGNYISNSISINMLPYISFFWRYNNVCEIKSAQLEDIEDVIKKVIIYMEQYKEKLEKNINNNINNLNNNNVYIIYNNEFNIL